MDKLLRYLFLLFNLKYLFALANAEQEHLQQKFTSKCDDLCTEQNENGTKELGKLECLRGCQYFNIEFLVNARNKDKVVDLNQLVERCGASCSEAYNGDKLKKELCFRGCNSMMNLQAKAPLINGWLVYMGATDRNFKILLQPDIDIPSKEDWVLLDSMFRASDYDYDSQYGSYEKITTQIETVPNYMARDRLTINYCIPVWIWVVPLFLLVAFIYIHYSNYIYGMFLSESLQHEFGLINPNQVNGVPIDMTGAEEKKCLRPHQEFSVGTDFYFYPAPVVPPPKYNEIVESILDSSDDENDTTAAAQANQKQCNPMIVTAKKNAGNDQRSSVVDI